MHSFVLFFQPKAMANALTLLRLPLLGICNIFRLNSRAPAQNTSLDDDPLFAPAWLKYATDCPGLSAKHTNDSAKPWLCDLPAVQPSKAQPAISSGLFMHLAMVQQHGFIALAVCVQHLDLRSLPGGFYRQAFNRICLHRGHQT